MLYEKLLSNKLVVNLSGKLKWIIKKTLKNTRAELFYVSRPAGRYFGHRIYGFVMNTEDSVLQYSGEKIISENGAAFYKDPKGIKKYKNWSLIDLYVPLKDGRSLLFFLYQRKRTYS